MLGILGGLGRKKSKRIALIDADGLSVYVLHKGQLIHDAKFSDEDVGYTNFRNYLTEQTLSPITLLVDTVAEDFLVESLPHVSYYDRKGFLNRKSLQHFRSLEYRSSSVVGREPGGRKNDKVLFSALTKNQIVEPWIRVLLQEEVPIQGVTTPAFALCKVAEHYELLSSKDTLLVNWEATGIRQTFVSNNRMMFSRLTQTSAVTNDELVSDIMATCRQSKEYLERIGLTKFGEQLDLHIITPQLDNEEFHEHLGEGLFRKIEHHRPAEMIAPDHYHGSDSSKTALILCLDWGVRHGQLANRYASPPVLRFNDLWQVRRIIYITCVASVLISAGIFMPLLLDATRRSARIDSLMEQILPIQLQYDSLTAEFPATPIPSEAMQLAVSNYQLFNEQIRNPIELMRAVSAVVARFPSVTLSSVEWELTGLNEDNTTTDALLAGEASPSINLVGTVRGGSSIATSQRQLGVFLQTLNRIEGAVATPISLPVESGPDGEVSTVINDDAVDAEFAIRVRQES